MLISLEHDPEISYPVYMSSKNRKRGGGLEPPYTPPPPPFGSATVRLQLFMDQQYPKSNVFIDDMFLCLTNIKPPTVLLRVRAVTQSK